MFTITEYVPASEIWATAKDHIDHGYKSGLVRGYNIEITTRDGETHWYSCSWIHEDPEEYFNDDFHCWMFNEHGWTPTGRICFRGYGIEEYDPDERDTFIKQVEV